MAMRAHLSTIVAMSLVAVGGCARMDSASRPRSNSARAHGVDAWVIAGHDGSTSQIRFRFPPPHDAYGGAVNRIVGGLFLQTHPGESLGLGSFVVSVRDVDMGEADLNQNVRYNAEFLRGQDFPNISYSIESITARPSDGEDRGSTLVTLHGRFKLKGVEIPLRIEATFTRDRDDAGRARLLMTGKFSLEKLQETFGVFGAGEPGDPAGDRLLLEFDFTLVPSGSPR